MVFLFYSVYGKITILAKFHCSVVYGAEQWNQLYQLDDELTQTALAPIVFSYSLTIDYQATYDVNK